MENVIVSYKLVLVKGLLTECPLDKPLDDCPAKKVRCLPLEKRLQLVEDMGESDLDLIISHHRHCFQKRRLEQPFEKMVIPHEAEIKMSMPLENYRDPILDKERVLGIY